MADEESQTTHAGGIGAGGAGMEGVVTTAESGGDESQVNATTASAAPAEDASPANAESDADSSTPAPKLPTLQDIQPPTTEEPSAPAQAALLQPLLQASTAAGTFYYCLPAPWLRQWKAYVDGRIAAPPAMIDTAPLVEKITEDFVLAKKDLLSSTDYEMIPETAWNHLISWYGFKGPAIKREAFQEGNTRLATAPLYPLTLPITLFRYPNTVATATGSASVSHGVKKEWDTVYAFSQQKIGDLKQNIATKLGVANETIRIWDFYTPSQLALLSELKTLGESNIIENNTLLVEFEHPFGKKFLVTGPQSFGSSTTYNYGYSQQTAPQPRAVVPGKQGLGNLGNTCFMNSGLQCLSACVPLTDYFISKRFERDINRDNPIGAKGMMAEAYGKLLTELWSSTSTPSSSHGGYYSYYSHYSYGVEPRTLKGVIERYAPQFSGYQQQDSQELLAFLLDGLHEDLNRILRKPYVEGVTGTPEDNDFEVAAKAWDGHKKRNDSVIVDHFQGQLKSKVVCPTCGNVSITFDPFMYLSLPLPIDNSRWVKCVFVPLRAPATKHAVLLKSTDTVAALFTIIANQVNELRAGTKKVLDEDANAADQLTAAHTAFAPLTLTAENVVMCELNYGAFYARFKPSDTIDGLEARETYYIYELDGGAVPGAAAKEATPAENGSSQMEGVQEAKTDEDDDTEVQTGAWAYLPTVLQYNESYGYSNFTTQTKAALPLIVSTPNRCTFKELYSRVCQQLLPYAVRPLPDYDTIMNEYNQNVAEYEARLAEEERLKEEERKRLEDEEKAAAAAAAGAATKETDHESQADSVSNVSNAAAAGEDRSVEEEDEEAELDAVEPGHIHRRSASSSEEDSTDDDDPAIIAARRAGVYGGSRHRRVNSSSSDDAGTTWTNPHHSNSSAYNNLYNSTRYYPASYAAAAAKAAPPPTLPPVAPPAFPFTISFSERYRHSSKAISPLDDAPIVFPTADDITFQLTFATKARFAEWIDEQKMRVLDEHPSMLTLTRAAQSGSARDEPPLPLKDCLDLFTTEEQLTEENMWYCSKCKEHVRAIKKLELFSLPRILVIHLKRFHFGSRLRRDKIGTLVEFPLENLDLSPYLLGHLEGLYEGEVDGSRASTPTEMDADSASSIPTASTDSVPPPPRAEPLYDLFAVSNHYGGMGGGHYTAYAKYRDDGSWNYYDDSSVRAANAADVQSTAAYVLFYHRKDVPWPKFDPSIFGSQAQPEREETPPPATSPALISNGRSSHDDSSDDAAKDTDSDNLNARSSDDDGEGGAGGGDTSYHVEFSNDQFQTDEAAESLLNPTQADHSAMAVDRSEDP